ncbi:30S ribosomal protein S9 [Candidatus Curtissbacteria bacterium RIFCSPHIGHO2_02_FULL_40_17]|uniref:Small ribosomal subunit protein uS9 n=4 Tax=Candidatus Curtissiibacteriota TaxID=1752717 RepID=A0A1F5GJH0_9BACT|nr:MAG: 30S ribosomal protein S9 [Candidatus Curtissbacteria bacterium RIFCSPHIGHO2_01_FULL_40_12]OGD91974.1 MAG: 30S ribosomal protein S9 [Candidatus Curtissbacteria bacterium RIFCSPHIGHO2_02_FULL_40_17]OGE05225.1 MAG: 30S ribosomal protein S9 [Candidatus Curtissbacteria bacterium RIFCSPHIGHO2_12_FULL_41_17]OGE08163.1 MAG: 30S ribosomal protein S9 [Candidatus Curtissbacteria bacterium RIFCSPLOWO2_02_FULL_40_13b]
MKKENQKSEIISAHGRRKEAVARVMLYKGDGQILVNGQAINQYFPSKVAKSLWQKPFVLTKSQNDYWATIKVSGSGKSGQLLAVVHGLSRALSKANLEFRPILKRAGLLTRDPRVKERRKYGLAQKARKGKQSPRR